MFHMLKITVLVCCMALAGQWGGPGMAQAAEHMVLGDDDNGGMIRMTTGQIMTLQLTCSPGAGYDWQLPPLDGSPLELMEPPRFEQGGSSMPGAPELQVFRFKAVCKGDFLLRLEYKRRWEQDVKAKRLFTLRITVQ